MAHEIETAMFVEKPAWHGLGTLLDSPPTAAEAIAAAGLDWQVELVDLKTADDGADVTHKLTRRATDKKHLGVVGPDFTVLQNREAFDWFNPFIENGSARFESAASLREGRRVFILAKLSKDPFFVLPGDEVEKYLLLAHGHDGSLCVHLGFTPIRVVCANTLRLSLGNEAAKLLRIKHTKGVKGTIDKVREIIEAADGAFEATAEQYRELARRSIDGETLKRYVNVVWKQPKKVSEAGDLEKPEEVSARIQSAIAANFEQGRGADIPGVRGSWWGAYNAVTEYLRHDRGSDGARRIDSALFGQGATLNQRALDVALDMALVK